ncbi:MAG TPA: hypothetical protein VGE69_02210 [Pseudomonadales bacterium]
MEQKNERRFWTVFVLFCVLMVTAGEMSGVIDLSTMTRAEHVIYTTALVLCGVVIRHWFRNNPEEVKKLFKS